MTKIPPVVTRVAEDLVGATIMTDQFHVVRRAIAQAMSTDQAAVRKRFGVLSTGEKAVASAILARCDYSEQADGWAGGKFLQMMSRTGGVHLAAALALLDHGG